LSRGPSAAPRTLVPQGTIGYWYRATLATLWTETDPLVDQHRERIERIATKLEVDREWSGEQVREVLREVQ